MNGLDIRKNRKKLGWSQQKLAEMTGLSRATINNYENGGVIPKTKSKIFDSIFKSALSDEANMEDLEIKSNNSPQLIPTEIIANKNGNRFIELPNGKFRIQVPKIPHTAYASFIEVFNDEYQLHNEFEETYFTVDKIGRGKYISFVTGNESMNGGSLYDTPGGADVLGRQIGKHLWQDGFHKSDYGFIIVAQSGIFHKDIENTGTNGVIKCLSRNPSPEFQPFELVLDEVHSIWKVIKRTF